MTLFNRTGARFELGTLMRVVGLHAERVSAGPPRLPGRVRTDGAVLRTWGHWQNLPHSMLEAYEVLGRRHRVQNSCSVSDAGGADASAKGLAKTVSKASRVGREARGPAGQGAPPRTA